MNKNPERLVKKALKAIAGRIDKHDKIHPTLALSATTIAFPQFSSCPAVRSCKISVIDTILFQLAINRAFILRRAQPSEYIPIFTSTYVNSVLSGIKKLFHLSDNLLNNWTNNRFKLYDDIFMQNNIPFEDKIEEAILLFSKILFQSSTTQRFFPYSVNSPMLLLEADMALRFHIDASAYFTGAKKVFQNPIDDVLDMLQDLALQ